MESMEGSLYLIVAIVAVLFVTFAAILSRYKRCPSDKILVVYGRTGKNATGGVSSARCIHGGARFYLAGVPEFFIFGLDSDLYRV